MRKLRPLLFSFVRNRRTSDRDLIEDGQHGSDQLTQDGTVDVRGRPASKSRTGGWKGGLFIIVEQVGANLAFFGVASNLVVYLTSVMHESNSTAANNTNNWNGVGYVLPLVAAFIADSYCGRYLGAVISSMIYILGLVMLTVAGSLHFFRPAQCPNQDVTCPSASIGQNAFLYAGLYVMDLGAGGVQGTVVAFGADQFDEEDDQEKLQKSSFFNWAYQTNLIGSFITNTFFVYIQTNFSFGIGWGISLAVHCLGTIVLLAGVRIYRYHKPGGNPLIRIAQVLAACARKWNKKVLNVDDLYEVKDTPESTIKGSRKILHSNKFRFLDKAAFITDKDTDKLHNPWRLSTVSQVEEVKFLLRVLPIFLTTIIYTTCYSQLSTLYIEQAYYLDRNLGSFNIPPASIDVFESISVLFWVVVYDRLLVPLLRKRTGNQRGISELQRIGIGLFLSICAMTIAAVVEIERLHVVHDHGLTDDTTTTVPMSVFWEVPQYFVMGASEVFTYIGMMEFFYDQAPDAIRSLGSALSLLTWGIGYFVSNALLKIVGSITTRGGKPGWIADNLNQGRVDLFYWTLAILAAINLMFFILCAMQYEYKVTQGPITGVSQVTPQQQKNDNQEAAVINRPAHNNQDS